MRIGIDLGGSKIEGILLTAAGTITERVRIATPQGNYAATLDAITQLVTQLEQPSRLRCPVGIGIPGTLSPASGRVKNANSTCLIGQRLDQDLAHRLQRPVRLANDANCFALSEAVDGAAAGAPVVFGVILGTGVGGGLVVNGQVLSGRNAIAGEWGHNPLPWAPDEPALPCYCGQKGCIETWLSGPALCQRYAMRGGPTLTRVEEICTHAQSGNTLAQQLLEDHTDWLARALASVINIVDPDLIVLGGGLSQLPHLYSAVPTVWPRYVFSDRVETPILPPKHGDSSGVRGAAWLWPADSHQQNG